jgi:hypothetical protein
MENGRLALKQRERFFGDFWHIHDDFAIKNATNIIYKAGKAQSYSSLHDLSNGAKRCKILSRNRQEIDTAKVLSIVIIQKKTHFASLNFFKFRICLTRLSGLHTSAWTVGGANTHCVHTRGPTCQGIDPPRHYQHTFIFEYSRLLQHVHHRPKL